jgi:hypothetical protein
MPRSRRQLNTATNLALAGLLVASFLSGWVAALLGLTEFAVHKYTSIGLVLAAAVHVGLHARAARAQLRAWWPLPRSVRPLARRGEIARGE